MVIMAIETLESPFKGLDGHDHHVGGVWAGLGPEPVYRLGACACVWLCVRGLQRFAGHAGAAGGMLGAPLPALRGEQAAGQRLALDLLALLVHSSPRELFVDQLHLPAPCQYEIVA